MNDTNLPVNKQNEIPAEDNNSTLSTSLAIADEWIRKNYLNRIGDMRIIEPVFDQKLEDDFVDRIRLFKISELSYQKGESIEEKLSTVYNALSLYPVILFMLIENDGEKTSLYLGVRLQNQTDQLYRSAVSVGEVLKQGLIGNFPGIQVEREDRKTISDLTKSILNYENIVAVSLKPDFKHESNRSEQQFTQGLEKFALAMGDRKYTALIIAENQSPDLIEQTRKTYMDLYSRLIPYQKIQISESKTSGTSRQKSFMEMTGHQKTVTIGNMIASIGGAFLGLHVGEGNQNAGFTMLGGQFGSQIGSLISSMVPVENISETSTQSKNLNYENKMITELLSVLDQRIKDCQEFDAFGM